MLTITAARMENAEFEDINLGGASFKNINLSSAKFNDVNLSNVDITEANLKGMTIDGVLVTELLENYKASKNL